jgi:hypothetical protein
LCPLCLQTPLRFYYREFGIVEIPIRRGTIWATCDRKVKWFPLFRLAVAKWKEIMLKRKKLLGIIIILLMYVGTWIDGSISLNQNLRQKAEASYRKAEQINRESVAAERHTGREPFLIPLHEGGPITSEWCVPLLPSVLLRQWESSIGPLGGGNGSEIVFCYVFGSTKPYSFGGWRN